MPEYNKQGRTMSESMRLKEFNKWLKTQPKPPKRILVVHAGERIEGEAGHYTFPDSPRDPRIFTSLQSAKDAIDRKHALRAELAENPRRPYIRRKY